MASRWTRSLMLWTKRARDQLLCARERRGKTGADSKRYRDALQPICGLELSDGPGIYLWSRAGVPDYVGTAVSLRKRLSTHLGAGLCLAGLSLRGHVCELLFHVPPNVTDNPARQNVTTKSFLLR